MKKNVFFILIFLLIGDLYAKEKIYWLEVNYPPHYIVAGKLKGQGYLQKARQLLKSNLDEYNHQVLVVPPSRVIAFFQQADKIYCTAGLGHFKSMFPQFTFANQSALTAPVGIVVRRKDNEKFSVIDQSTSLEDLIKKRKYRLGIVKDVSWGKAINALLKKYSSKDKFFYRSFFDQESFYDMLFLDRLDFILEYASSFGHKMMKYDPSKRKQLMFVSLKEDTEAAPVYAVCNNSPHAKKIIKSINQTMRTKKYRREVTKQLIFFLPKNLKRKFRRINLMNIGKP